MPALKSSAGCNRTNKRGASLASKEVQGVRREISPRSKTIKRLARQLPLIRRVGPRHGLPCRIEFKSEFSLEYRANPFKYHPPTWIKLRRKFSLHHDDRLPADVGEARELRLVDANHLPRLSQHLRRQERTYFAFGQLDPSRRAATVPFAAAFPIVSSSRIRFPRLFSFHHEAARPRRLRLPMGIFKSFGINSWTAGAQRALATRYSIRSFRHVTEDIL